MINNLKRQSSRVLHHWNITRSISIKQSSTNGLGKISENKTITDVENIQESKELKSHRILENAEFKTLGTPQTALSINSPPSVPVYIRRGSLLSIYGLSEISSIDSVRSTLEFQLWWKRLLYGGFVSTYQKLISTTPFSILVSSSSRNYLFPSSSNKSFISLNLDGTNDWAVLNKNAIQVYTGNSLHIGLHTLPRTISKNLAQALKTSSRTPTGLFSWKQMGYTLLTGRGQVGLVGGGSIYNINLDKDEQVLINKNNLLAITVNGSNDLQNCIVKYSFPLQHQSINTNREIKPLVKFKPTNNFGVQLYKLQQVIQSGWKTISEFISRGKRDTFNFLVGNQEFIKVVGPRNILLQSNSPITRSSNKPVRGTNHNITQVESTTTPTEKKPEDYLNYVTIEPGKGAVFKSTPDFSETIKEIESHKKA
ncbi:Altered inheritance of mitochondria protein 24 mitochondrial [Spathaspora sp. JA1]|nr:Altered inheritance of mitochondria protein 24 mitochondrial [Spathaspora sp. JA1]